MIISRNIALLRDATALALAVLAATAHSATPSVDPTARQEDVARRGAAVMPFDLDATTHVFVKEAAGGTQRVTAKAMIGTTPAAKAEQIKRVRSHLQTVAAQFVAGNYGAPAAVHGAQMPGLAALEAARPGEVAVRYADVPEGGELRYRSDEPELVTALHAWFDAQVSDHGRHANHGTSGADGMSQHRH